MRRRQALSLLALSPLLACDGRVRSEGADVAPWVRYAGRIMISHDSLGIGYTDLVGGFRPELSAALTAAGVQHSYAGPYSDAYGAHRSVSGTAAVLQTSALQTDCETYDPRVVLLGYGVNDLGGNPDGQQQTVAQFLTGLSNCIAWAQAGAPQAIVIVQSVPIPGPAFPTYYARRALNEEANSLLPSFCEARRCRFVSINDSDAFTSDGVHRTAAGYTLMAAALSGAILGALPGAS